ncbi:hypothetical protein AK812_SmicGene20743 [Symbiodinium microadriaticum]|uniref:PDZ domain-containing protein n=1 Tax=Symbiodinium microadriaticum TaxID=2951 RepID=A0A1Q9DPC1_SYMMI|nr:hypothetical protein AK812_SmicGene20743 [Symbiodinium microadriaticum]
MLCTCFHGRKWQSRCFCISFCISFPSNFFQAWLPMALMFFGASQGRVAASEVKTRSDICGTLHVAQAMGEMLLDLLRINRPRSLSRISTSWQEPTNEGLPQGSATLREKLQPIRPNKFVHCAVNQEIEEAQLPVELRGSNSWQRLQQFAKRAKLRAASRDDPCTARKVHEGSEALAAPVIANRKLGLRLRMFTCCCVDEKPADFVELQMDSAFPEGKGAASPSAPVTFDIFLDRAPGTYFGVDLSSAGKACVVTSVTTDGLIADWNSKCSEETKVQKYDRLYAVNGQASEKSKEILDLLKSTHNKMVLTFQRAVVSEVKIQRGALNLGMHLKDGPHFLLVLGVDDGVVKDFNKTVPAEQQIQQSDRIVGVDGFEGVGAALMDKVRNAGSEVTLKVLAWRP